MSRGTRSQRQKRGDLSPGSENSFETSLSSHNGSHSFRSDYQPHSSFSDFDEPDEANVSGFNLTYLVDVEDLDASAELVNRSDILGGGFSPKARRRSPRFSDASSPGSPSSHKKTRRLDDSMLGRRAIHSVTSETSPPAHQRSFGVKAAKEAQQRQGQRQHQKSTHKAPESNLLEIVPHWCWVCFLLAAAFVVILVIKPLSVTTKLDNPLAAVSDREQMLQTFDKGLDGLRKTFPSQSKRFWRVIVAATRSLLRSENPPEPAVLMLAMTRDSRGTASCFVEQYAELLTETYKARDALILNMSRFDSNKAPDSVKLFLDDTLSQRFREGSRVAVLHQLESLQGQSAMIFHGYCDNDNAPHKDAVLIFTVEMDSVPSETDAAAEDYLSSRWSEDLEIDKYTALLSRIAKSIAFVSSESPEQLKSLCS